MTETTATADHPSNPLFVRPTEGRMFAGVCAGVAQRWHLDVTLVRIVTVVGVAGAHLGSRTYTVASTSDLRSTYDYGAGTVKLNLASINSVSGEHKTSVHLGRGAVVVTVPQGVPVLVHARAGVGSVKIDGHKVSGVDAEQTVPIGDGTASATDRIVLDITVGAGSVTVR